MQITDVRLRKVNSENRMKAVASVTFDNEFVVHDIKVIESQDGLNSKRRIQRYSSSNKSRDKRENSKSYIRSL